MQAEKIQLKFIVNTSKEILSKVMRLLNQVLHVKRENSYKIWNKIDIAGLKKDIENCHTY